MISAFPFRLSDLILSSFNGNIFLLTSGLHKILKALVQIFHDIIFFWIFCVFFFYISLYISALFLPPPPPPPHLTRASFFSVTSGFTRLSITTKYVCRGLIRLHVNFHSNRTKWSTNLHVKICRRGEGKRAYISFYISFFSYQIDRFWPVLCQLIRLTSYCVFRQAKKFLCGFCVLRARAT